jgi:hypothetical protein
VRAGRRTICALVVLVLVQAGPTIAYQTEVQRYYDSMRDICRTGVTPAMTAAWVQAREALGAARYGGGRDNNFAGIKTPTDTWLDCFQSPGDGKE